MIKVIAFGTFDGVHPGHVDFLQQAKKLGGHLTVIIARDSTVLKIKGRPPKQGEKDRQEALRHTQIPDEVILGDLIDFYQPIRKVQPNIIALGYDQKVDLKGLEDAFPKAQKVRLRAFHPEQYKSSLMKGRF